jgi:hypothetical protein
MIDVLTYEFAESNPQGYPNGWPMECKESNGSELLPNWIRFNTVEEYQTYLETNRGAYNTSVTLSTLNSQKLDTWLNIKAFRDLRQLSGFKVGNYWFHSDDASRIKYLGLMMMGANIPSNLMWKTMSGEFVSMTQTLATQIFMGIAGFDSAAFLVAEQHKAAMQNSSEPTHYDYSTGWPAIYGE